VALEVVIVVVVVGGGEQAASARIAAIQKYRLMVASSVCQQETKLRVKSSSVRGAAVWPRSA
jgi:hypothetical protein